MAGLKPAVPFESSKPQGLGPSSPDQAFKPVRAGPLERVLGGGWGVKHVGGSEKMLRKRQTPSHHTKQLQYHSPKTAPKQDNPPIRA